MTSCARTVCERRACTSNSSRAVRDGEYVHVTTESDSLPELLATSEGRLHRDARARLGYRLGKHVAQHRHRDGGVVLEDP